MRKLWLIGLAALTVLAVVGCGEAKTDAGDTPPDPGNKTSDAGGTPQNQGQPSL